jgi:hypothetical protein
MRKKNHFPNTSREEKKSSFQLTADAPGENYFQQLAFQFH